MVKCVSTFINCAIVLVVATVVSAQTRATSADLSGTVYDQTNALLPGVTMTVTTDPTPQQGASGRNLVIG